MGIFHAYDVRAIYGTEITVEVAVKLGHAYAQYLKGKKVVIGHDPRLGGEECANAFTEALMDNGVDVIFCGLITTPMLYFAVNHFEADGGVMVTASHNPKEYIGFKFTREKAIPIASTTGIEEIEKLYNNLTLPSSPKSRGNCEVINIQKEYTSFILGYAQEVGKTTVVIDCSNGSAGSIMPRIVPNLQANITLINEIPDGTFPNHAPNPLDLEASKQLSEEVVKRGAEIGAFFDGDADRIAFVDEKGQFISPDLIGAILGVRMVDVARRSKQKPLVLYDLRSTRVVPQEVHANGGTTLMSRVGHSFIKKQMRDEDAFFALELSGHYYYKSFFYCDNAVITLFEVLSFMANHAKPLSQIVEEYSSYAKIHETNIKVDNVARCLELLKNAYPDARIEELDGVSIIYDEWWCNVRPSNTEPLLRINLEAQTEKLMSAKKDEILKLLTKPL